MLGLHDDVMQLMRCTSPPSAPEIATNCSPASPTWPRYRGSTYVVNPFTARTSLFAGRIAVQVPGSLVIVVGKIKWQGKDAMIGAMYAPEQPPSRVGVVLGNDLQAARDLASFLMTDKPAPNVTRLATPPWESLAPAQVGGGLSASTKWIVIGGGAVAIAGGAGLYTIGGVQGWHTARPYGVGLGIAGALAVGIGLWLGPGSQGGPVVSASSSRAMITWAGNF